MADEVVIAPLADARSEAAIALLARAFRDNPLDRAVIGPGPERRQRSIAFGMRSALRTARAGACTVLAAVPGGARDGIPLGILLAVPPDGFPLPPPPLLGHLRSLVGQGLRVAARWGEVYRALEAVHPTHRHWYLSLLGVDPPHQGGGIGWALLSSWLESVDRAGMPSYLETDREENLAFYGRAGFAVQLELEVVGTRVWCLSRGAAGPAESRTGEPAFRGASGEEEGETKTSPGSPSRASKSPESKSRASMSRESMSRESMSRERRPT